MCDQPRQLKKSQIDEVRAELSMNQLGKCLLCKRDLDTDGRTPHTDHCHQTGKIRGVLCAVCNTLEGTIHHKFTRSGAKGKGVDYYEWLINLANYLTLDYSDNDYHPNHMADQTKEFAKLRIAEQKELMDKLGLDYKDNARKKDLEKIYKKSFIANPRTDFDNGKYDTLDV